MFHHPYFSRTAVLRAFVLAVAVSGAASATATPARAQNPLEVLKKQAEEAKKKAEETRKKAEALKAKTDSVKAAAAAAKQDAAATKAAAEEAARNVREGLNPTSAPATSSAQPAAPSPAANRTPVKASGAPAAAAPGGAVPISKSQAKVEEQVLLSGEAGTQFFLSPRGQHVAAAVLRGSRTVVSYDGVDGPKFDEILTLNVGPFVFSENGNRYAYVGRQGDDWVVMVDGKEMARGRPWYQSTGQPTVTHLDFTPGDKHVWFTTGAADSQNPAYRLYIDGKPGPTSMSAAESHQVLFSANGERHAYVIQVRDRAMNPTQILIIDGKPSPYPGGDPQFTADGLHVFTKAHVPRSNAQDIFMDGQKFMRVNSAQLHMAPVGSLMLGVVWTDFEAGKRISFLTVGNKRVPGSDCTGSGGIDGVYFTPDAKHWAVKCDDGPSRAWVMADGKKGANYQRISSGIEFTADGRPVYIANMNNKSFMVIGDQELGPYATLRPLLPRTDEQRPAPEPAFIAGNRVGFIAEPTQGKTVAIVDGKATPAEAATYFSFSPDGSRHAYVVGISAKQVVVDGGQPFAAPIVDNPVGAATADRLPYVFSPDGKYVAWGTDNPAVQYGRALAINGKRIPSATTHNMNFMFTPDSKHVFWLAKLAGKPRMALYVDGAPAVEFDMTLGLQNEPHIWWSVAANGVLTFVAQDGGALKRFRVTPTGTGIEALLAKAR